MSKIKFRQKQLILSASIGAVSMLLICGIIGYFVIDNLQHKHRNQTVTIKQELQTTKDIINLERIEVPALNKDIAAGNILKADDIKYVSLPKNAVPEDISDKSSLIGRYVKLDLQKNTPVLDSMLYEDEITTDDIRSQEFRLIELPTKLKNNDFVDVRVKFPTGQDYIVLSKKRVEDLSNGTVWHQMNEKEILMMSSAIVDAYINNANIYALTYIDPAVQKKAATTYPPNQDVLDLIESDPNIVDVATTELERRYRQKLESSLQSLSMEQLQSYKDKSAKSVEKSNTDLYEGSSSVNDIPNQENPLLETGYGDTGN